MCTVTFILAGDKIFITSNRDERNDRKQASPPAAYHYKDSQLIFPRDGETGGTWIAMNGNGNAAVLLNGAFKKFVQQPFYIKSRGLVLLEVIADMEPVALFKKIDLHLTAPFTLVIWEHYTLFECRWDGVKKYTKQLDGSAAHIWSSATLYNYGSMKKRAGWLGKFLRDTPAPVMKDIVNFHLLAGEGDDYDSLKMSRDGIYSTVSITSIEFNQSGARMFYYDCSDIGDDKRAVKSFTDFPGKFIPHENS